ncbi:hypothetical protein BGZ83_005621 [Gryganskiella cystojenkinii]|nr:hypothetical protein BGZ83_005621 [Gryganskiella cystojenkinii]
MRSNPTSLLVFILCLASAVKAAEDNISQQEQEQQTKQEEPTQNESSTATSNQQQSSFQIPPMELTSEQATMFREGARQFLSQVPAQTVEPLFETIDGYCKAFESICTLACNERRPDATSAFEQEFSKPTQGCENLSARSVALAHASCVCAGYDLTDRVNFAVVGGVVTSKSKPTSDFTAEGFLDGLSFIPGVPIFLNIAHVLQGACHFLDKLVDPSAAPATPDSSAPAPALTVGGEGAGGIGGFLSNLLPGGIGGMLGNLFGGGKKATPTSESDERVTTTVNPEVPPTPESDPATSPVVATSPPPKPVANSGGLFGWLPKLWAETDDQGQFIEGQEEADAGEQNPSRIVSRDGRIARITRVQQQKQAEMAKKRELVQEQEQKEDL